MSRRMLTLNGLAIFATVLHHAPNWVLTGVIWWADRFSDASVPDFSWVETPGYFVLRLLDQPAVLAIPIFLFISGYFVSLQSAHETRIANTRAIIKRVGKLVPPYILWSIFFIFLGLVEGTQYTPGEILNALVRGNVAAPYYYVPMLLTFYLISPVILWLVRWNWKVTLTSTALLQFVGVCLRIAVQVLTRGDTMPTLLREVANSHLIMNGSWFILGVVFASHQKAVKKGILRAKSWLIVGSVLFLALGVLESDIIRRLSDRYWIAFQNGFFNTAFQYCFLLVIFAFKPIASTRLGWLIDLGTKSYAVYLVHVPVQELLARSMYHLAPGILAYPLLFFLLLVVTGLGIPLLGMDMIRRSGYRRINALVFGR